MEPILVTGGAGYIGSQTCKALSGAGYLPVTYDDLSRGHAWAVQWGPMEVGNIADGERLASVVRRYRPRAVVHFAGFGYVGESMEAPQLYYGNNIIQSAMMLETLRQTGIRHLVFSSSCATYGAVAERAIDESIEQRPISTYGFSKLVIERMLSDYSRAFGFRSIALRYFNAAGADPTGELGECHDPEPHFIPVVLRAADEGTQLRINGDDYPTPDGTCVRDYVHVHDLAQGHVLALRALLDGGITGAFNLGNGRGYSLMEVVDLARRVTGRDIATEIGPRRVGDPPYAVAATGRAAETLGWKPEYSEMQQIVEHAWRWMRSDTVRAHKYASCRAGLSPTQA